MERTSTKDVIGSNHRIHHLHYQSAVKNVNYTILIQLQNALMILNAVSALDHITQNPVQTYNSLQNVQPVVKLIPLLVINAKLDLHLNLQNRNLSYQFVPQKLKLKFHHQ